jgi:hypothetical protein
MPTSLIPLATPTPLVQNVVYALPIKGTIISSGVAVEVSQSLAGPWAAYAAGTMTAASFVRCPTANTTLTCK